MSRDYVTALADRHLGTSPAIMPRLPARFEPAPVALDEPLHVETLTTAPPIDVVRPTSPIEPDVPRTRRPDDAHRTSRATPRAPIADVVLPRASRQAADERDPGQASNAPRDDDGAADRVDAGRLDMRVPVAAVASSVARPALERAEVVSPRPHRPSEAGEPGARGERAARDDAADAVSTVEVTIGRIEVRAIQAPPAPQPARARSGASPMSLAEYLRAREAGRR